MSKKERNFTILKSFMKAPTFILSQSIFKNGVTRFFSFCYINLKKISSKYWLCQTIKNFAQHQTLCKIQLKNLLILSFLRKIQKIKSKKLRKKKEKVVRLVRSRHFLKKFVWRQSKKPRQNYIPNDIDLQVLSLFSIL